MKLKKVTKVKDHIYEIIYVGGFFKTYKSALVYCCAGNWRFIETGKYIPYSLGTSLSTIVQGLESGESFHTECLK